MDSSPARAGDVPHSRRGTLVRAALLVSAVVASLGSCGPDHASDVVTLRDGKVILGQWIESAPKGKPALLSPSPV